MHVSRRCPIPSIGENRYARSSESQQPRLGGAHGRRRRRLLQAARGQQAPEYLWIGCSDSRVPANEIVGLDPGELFVHRNVANLAPPQDANYLSVLQFAVDVLKVKHVMVVGHYGCGGVGAAVDGKRRGLVDHWLHPDPRGRPRASRELDAMPTQRAASTASASSTSSARCSNVASDVFVQDAWARGQDLCVHGWVYSLADGLVNDLDVTVGQA